MLGWLRLGAVSLDQTQVTYVNAAVVQGQTLEDLDVRQLLSEIKA